MTTSFTDLINKLEKEYPDTASSLKGKDITEVKVYLAQLEMIAYIKMLASGDKKKKQG